MDANQPEIVRALRAIGCSVQSLAAVGDGCPDLLVGHRGRNLVLEVKDSAQPPSKRRLTPAEADWHATWEGTVRTVETIDDAIREVMGA